MQDEKYDIILGLILHSMWLEIGLFIIFIVILWYFVYRISIWLKYSESVVTAYNEFMTLFEDNKYFSKRDLKKWLGKWSFLKSKYEHQLSFRSIFKDSGNKIDKLLKVFESPEKLVTERNENFIKKELVDYDKLFRSIESGFNLDQKRAVIVDEANNLIIAGAGTGKTSTLLAKAAYITKKGLATP